MNAFLAIALGLTLVVCGYPRDQATERAFVTVPPAVAIRVTPVLDAIVRSRKASPTASPFAEWFKVEKPVTRVMEDRSPAADEALVVLVQFYIGESTSEDLNHEITKRGRRMLPYLRKYRRDLARIAGRQYPDSIRLEPETWKENIDADIESIQKGRVRFED